MRCKQVMLRSTDLVGLLRVRPSCCLFTWRERQGRGGQRGTKTVEVDDRHCVACVEDLRQLAPEVLVIDGRSRSGHAPEPCLVLVVDDEPDIRAELAGGLQDLGCQVISAADGAEALSYLRSGAPLPRLILLDLMMPVMDGEQFLEWKQADERLARIPVVVVTARGGPAHASAAAVVRKPFRMEAIGRLIEEHRGRP
jgi:CheY-like chemotaxis protein